MPIPPAASIRPALKTVPGPPNRMPSAKAPPPVPALMMVPALVKVNFPGSAPNTAAAAGELIYAPAGP